MGGWGRFNQSEVGDGRAGIGFKYVERRLEGTFPEFVCCDLRHFAALLARIYKANIILNRKENCTERNKNKRDLRMKCD
jgi:hypothetical protein